MSDSQNHADRHVGPGIAFDDDGELIGKEEFDFDQVDENLTGDCPAPGLEHITRREMIIALKMFEMLVRWMFQNGFSNLNGLQIRAVIVCWIFLPNLHGFSMTRLAEGMGKDKQSLGRWHDDFKKKFPFIRTPHMRVKQKPA